ncbi:hypothetical protein F2Q69_00023871 [Brassica cretica]|uniref:Uncharacterized protein n=1 Tax=Brassica cretica TaxID=69181 RepID=A0A8S9QGP7_BRACR|nr:hypothetical protein F2Q69_00023871 [Brassica cretica]
MRRERHEELSMMKRDELRRNGQGRKRPYMAVHAWASETSTKIKPKLPDVREAVWDKVEFFGAFLWDRVFLESGTVGSSAELQGSSAKVGESEGRALASHQLSGKGMDQEVFKRADLEAFFKALNESGNTLGNTLGYSYAAHTLPSTADKLLDIFKSSYTAAIEPSSRWCGVVVASCSLPSWCLDGDVSFNFPFRGRQRVSPPLWHVTVLSAPECVGRFSQWHVLLKAPPCVRSCLCSGNGRILFILDAGTILYRQGSSMSSRLSMSVDCGSSVRVWSPSYCALKTKVNANEMLQALYLDYSTKQR